MAQFYTDFAKYTTSSEPSDWTDYWTATTFVVGADAGYTGGKYCALTELNAYARTGYGWDTVGSSDADLEIVFRFNSKSGGILFPALRASGTTSRNGYVLLVRNDTNVLDIRRSVNSAETSLGTQAITINDNTLYWVRFRINGDDIKVRFWADGDAEPASWTKEITDSSGSKISSAGRVQLGTTGNTSSPFWIDVVGVGTNGDTAPTEALTSNGERGLYIEGATASPTNWYNASWGYRVKVTVQASQIASTLTDFPVYVDLSDLPAGFHTNCNQTDARDIRVTRSDGVTECAREVVSYDSTNDKGELHFKANSISSSADTDFYIYYGNSSASDYATTATYGRNAVWSGYHRVYHLEDSMTDSSGNNDGTNYSTTDTTGKIERGRDFSGANNQRIEYGPVNKTDNFSLQLWMNPDTVGDSDQRFGGASTAVTGHSVLAFRLNSAALNVWDGAWRTCGKSLSASSWQHVSFNFGVASSGSLTLGTQLDGSNPSNVTATQTTWGLNRDNFNLGGKYATYGNEYDGQIDEFRISKSVLSTDHAKTDYNNQSSPSTFYTAGSQEEPSASGTNADSERGLYLGGKTSSGSERLLHVSGSQILSTDYFNVEFGSASTNADSERGLYIEGKDTSVSERALSVTGCLSNSSERTLYVTGCLSDNSERSLYLTGSDSGSSERSLYLGVVNTGSSTRNLYVPVDGGNYSDRFMYLSGKDTSSSERGLYVTGGYDDSSERSLYLEVVSTSSSERALYVGVVDIDFSERSLYLIGSIDDSGERNLYLEGFINENSERSLYLTGSLPGDSERNLYLGVVNTGSSERSIYLGVVNEGTSERNLYITGGLDDDSERLLYLSGKDTSSSDRNLYLTGSTTDSSERSLYLEVVSTGDSQRGLYITGCLSDNSERTLYLSVNQASSSERGMWLHGGMVGDAEVYFWDGMSWVEVTALTVYT